MAIRTYQQFTPLLGERAFVDASAVVEVDPLRIKTRIPDDF